MLYLQLIAVLVVLLVQVRLHAQPLDGLFDDKHIPETKLLEFLTHSTQWLKLKAVQANNTALEQYTLQLLQVQKPACTRCVDYFEAVALVRGMGKAIRELLGQEGHDIVHHAVRRSFIAAVWLLQRSKMFVWESSRLETNAVGTMLRLYLHHVKRAQGRTISFHHISKCGGTSICQLAATNKCSNPHLGMEKNCVLDDRLDSPIWMVAHKVNESGAFPDNVTGVVDITPSSPVYHANYNRHDYSTEPPLPMWLMYTCPYQLTGKPYTCQARLSDVRKSGTTFLAVERTLSPLGVKPQAAQHNTVQVCPEFVNAVTLRQPVSHAISLMAEVKFRYMRQLQQKSITTWEPPAWNLTWWETFGPALVGSYATRTLVGRESFCRSAANMATADLHQAVHALLGFDMVMTLDRAKDIDLLITTLLGWPAEKFSSQPAKRVRSVASQVPLVMGMPVRLLLGDVPSGDDASNIGAAGDFVDGQQISLAAAVQHLKAMWYADDQDQDAQGNINSSSHSRGFPASSGTGIGSSSRVAARAGSGEAAPAQDETADTHRQLENELPGGDDHGIDDDDASMDKFDRSAAQYELAFDMPLDELQAELPAPVMEAQAALALVRTSVLNRQSQLLGYTNITAALAAGAPVLEPRIEMLQERSRHGAHQLRVAVNGYDEVWHAFPRHSFAFRAADMQRLEVLTHVDAQLFEVADLMMDLDKAWLLAILRHSHYRQKLKSIVQTHTACGFAGILAQPDQMQNLLHN